MLNTDTQHTTSLQWAVKQFVFLKACKAPSTILTFPLFLLSLLLIMGFRNFVLIISSSGTNTLQGGLCPDLRVSQAVLRKGVSAEAVPHALLPLWAWHCSCWWITLGKQSTLKTTQPKKKSNREQGGAHLFSTAAEDRLVKSLLEMMCRSFAFSSCFLVGKGRSTSAANSKTALIVSHNSIILPIRRMDLHLLPNNLRVAGA